MAVVLKLCDRIHQFNVIIVDVNANFPISFISFYSNKIAVIPWNDKRVTHFKKKLESSVIIYPTITPEYQNIK